MDERTVRPGESCCSTGDFARLGRGYTQHCGPTAITNLILTLAARSGQDELLPERVFSLVVGLGERRYYWNLSLFGRFGGTSDLLSPRYLRAALDKFCFESVRVGRLQPLNEKTLRAAAARGDILYLQTHFHRRYGNHHMLCYGAFRSPETGDWVLRLADGHARGITLLPLRELPRCSFVPLDARRLRPGGTD